MSIADTVANRDQLSKRDIVVGTRHLQVGRVLGGLCDVLVTLRHWERRTEGLGAVLEVMRELVAEVRLVREVEFKRHRLVRPAFRDQFLRQPAAERPRPLPRRLLEAFREVPLQQTDMQKYAIRPMRTGMWSGPVPPD